MHWLSIRGTNKEILHKNWIVIQKLALHLMIQCSFFPLHSFYLHFPFHTLTHSTYRYSHHISTPQQTLHLIVCAYAYSIQFQKFLSLYAWQKEENLLHVSGSFVGCCSLKEKHGKLWPNTDHKILVSTKGLESSLLRFALSCAAVTENWQSHACTYHSKYLRRQCSLCDIMFMWERCRLGLICVCWVGLCEQIVCWVLLNHKKIAKGIGTWCVLHPVGNNWKQMGGNSMSCCTVFFPPFILLSFWDTSWPRKNKASFHC